MADRLVVIEQSSRRVVVSEASVRVLSPLAQGPSGPVGRSVFLTGETAPQPEDGQDGDMYLNTSLNLLHGPKAGGSWPAGVPLEGSSAFFVGNQPPNDTSLIWIDTSLL